MPKTGYPSDETGKIVAENIIRLAKGETNLKRKAWEKYRTMHYGRWKKKVIISQIIYLEQERLL